MSEPDIRRSDPDLADELSVALHSPTDVVAGGGVPVPCVVPPNTATLTVRRFERAAERIAAGLEETVDALPPGV